MQNFNFRLHFILADSGVLGIQSPVWEYTDPVNIHVILRPLNQGQSIQNEKDFELVGESWISIDEAWNAGKKFRDALIYTLIQLHLGGKFGSDDFSSGLSTAKIYNSKNKNNLAIRYDHIGLDVFETDVSTVWAQLGKPKLGIVIQPLTFESIFRNNLNRPRNYSTKGRLAINLYNQSFFQASPEARFLILVMAVEALLEPKKRSSMATSLIQGFIDGTKKYQGLSSEERNSIISSLSWLSKESIGKTGRDLASTYLTGSYMKMEPPDFFKHCYDVRSKFVHGNKEFTPEEIGKLASNLEIFVADLINAIFSNV
jgi:hypothetical protein